MNKVIRSIEKGGISFYARHAKWLWLIYGVVFVWVSYRCFGFALESSLDMQWYPTLHFWGLGSFHESINPYWANLNGDRFMSNDPNYMPLLYFLMYPFGRLGWGEAKIAFAFLNFFAFLLTLLIAYCKSKNKAYIFLFSSLVILGFTYTNVISNAQSTILIGLCITIAYFFRHNPWILSVALAFALVKHSVGIPVLFGFFLAGYRREVIYAGIIMGCVITLSALKFDISPFDFIHMMLEVNAKTYASPMALGGPGDLMSLSQKIFHSPYSVISYLGLFFYGVFALIVLKYKPQTAQIISASIVLSLVTLPHLGYDYYLLFIALVLLVQIHQRGWAIFWGLAVSVFLWRCSFLKPWIDSISQKMIPSQTQTYWAMDMGIPFCVGISLCLICMVILILISHINVNKKE